MAEERVSSPQNLWVKRLRWLHSRKGRQRFGQFFAEGTRLLEEAQRAGWRPERVFYVPQRLRTPRDSALLQGWLKRKVLCLEMEESLFLQLADTESPQGILAIFPQRLTPLRDLQPTAGSRYLLLEGLKDPGNVGTLLRTAQAFGVEAVLFLGGVDPFNPKAVRASMGAIFQVSLVMTSLEEFARWRGQAQPSLALVASVPRGGEPLPSFSWPFPFVLALGNEVEGLSQELLHLADARVSIPMFGETESLNVAVAGSVLLYEAWRQRSP